MASFSRDDLEFIDAIKRRHEKRDRARKEIVDAIAESFDSLNNSKLRPTSFLMTQADFDDILAWSKDG